jgi:outer membrane protein assembly factor BamB
MFRSPKPRTPGMAFLLAVCFLSLPVAGVAGEAWPQLKYDGGHCGNVPDRSVAASLGLIGAVPLTDAVFTAPVVADGRVYVVDAAGVAFCLDTATLRVVWKVKTRGGQANCSNVSSPAIAGRYLHFGTTAGSYYVLERESGKVVREMRWGDPIFSAPVVGSDRVYIATLGSRVYALQPDGTVCWSWDFVKKQLGFDGDRWSGKDWVQHNGERVDFDDQFCCSRDAALDGKTLVVPAGPWLVWLEDLGDHPEVRATYRCRESESFRVTTMGLSIGEDGSVYRQTHRIDNGGEVERLRLRDGKVEADRVPGTETAANLPGSLSFSSVSVRGSDVYRCRPEEGFGFCKHAAGQAPLQQYAGAYPSIAAPILLRDRAVYGGLDGRLYVVPLSGGPVWSFKTALGKAISAPAAVCDGRVYFGCEDGYLYVLGPDGNAPLPSEDLRLWEIRSRLATKFTDPRYDWFTSFGHWDNTNANEQALAPPFRMRWIRRHGEALFHLWRRPDVYGHRRGPDLRRRAGHGPVVVAAVFSRSPHLLYHAALLQGTLVDPASRIRAMPPALPGRGHGEAPVGSSF